MSPCEAFGISEDPLGLIVWFLVLSKPVYVVYVDTQEVGTSGVCGPSAWLEPVGEGSAGALLSYLEFGAFIVLNHPFVLRNIRSGVPAVLALKMLPR